MRTSCYAGTENGLWISYDRGRPLGKGKGGLAGCPGLRRALQPAANDLLLANAPAAVSIRARRRDTAATARRGARARRLAVFDSRRDAVVVVPVVEAGDGNALPSTSSSRRTPPSGAVITFYQRRAAKQRPWLEILDAQGHAVRTLRGSFPTDDGRKYFVTNVAASTG